MADIMPPMLATGVIYRGDAKNAAFEMQSALRAACPGIDFGDRPIEEPTGPGTLGVGVILITIIATTAAKAAAGIAVNEVEKWVEDHRTSASRPASTPEPEFLPDPAAGAESAPLPASPPDSEVSLQIRVGTPDGKTRNFPPLGPAPVVNFARKVSFQTIRDLISAI